MNLSVRLQFALDLLKKNLVTADIGCDHGYLSIAYAMDNYPTKVYAIDEKKMPLDSCKQNIDFYESKGSKLDNIELVLSSGFRKINKDVEQVVICGVGGDNIISMFKEKHMNLDNVKNFVFQANNNTYFLRKYMNSIDYKIMDEKIFEEDGIIYEIIRYEVGNEELSEEEMMFGPILLKEKNEYFIKKYQDEILRLTQTLERIPERCVDNRLKIQNQINFIKKVI